MPPASAKNAIARVWLKPGNGSITVNGKDFDSSSPRLVLQDDPAAPSSRPPARTSTMSSPRSPAAAFGPGGRGAPRSISQALIHYEPGCAVLKKGGFPTRDSRVVERKKYGRAKARRSFQFSKR